MKDKGTPVFRTAMRGFNKKDVNTYIAGLCRDFEERDNESENKISELEEKVKELAAAADTAKEIETLKNTIAQSEALISAQNEKLAANSEEITSLNTALAEAEKKISELSQFEEKISQYDAMTSRMGEIFMEATADAERIRREAKTSSEELARAAAEECRKRQAEVYKKLDDFAVARRSEINKLFEEAQAEISGTLKDFENRARGVVSSDMADDIDSVTENL